MDFDWGGVISSGLEALIGGAASAWGVSAQQDAADEQYERALAAKREETALELQLAALKAAYGSGGGGGGSGPFTGITDAQKVAAMQAQSDTRQGAIQSALQGLTKAQSLGVRY